VVCMNHETVSDRPVYIEALASLRFFAAFGIIIQHASNHNLVSSSVVRYLDLSKSVSFFFVLSGFVLSYIYYKRNFSLLTFIRARILRIWPAMVVSILFTILLLPPGLYLPESTNVKMRLWTLMYCLTGLQSWFPIPNVFFAYNAVTWTISVEMFFYIVFPFLIRRRKIIFMAAATSFIVAVLFIFGIYLFDISSISDKSYGQVAWEGLIYINPLSRMIEFCLGVTCGIIFRSKGYRAFLEKIKMSYSSCTLPFLEFGICILPLIVLIRNTSGASVIYQPLALYLDQCRTAVLFSLLVIIIASRVGPIEKLLVNPALIHLGEVSYGLYLFHQPLMIRAAQADGLKFLGYQVLPHNLFIILVFTYALAFISWQLVEKPMIRLR